MATAKAEMIDANGREVRLSSPDKVLFPDAPGGPVTKRLLADYYLAVADGVMRAVGGRPLTLNRFPDGIDGESFYAKRVPKGAPDWLASARIAFPSGRPADEPCATEIGALVWAVNMGALELHPWPVRKDDTDHPDELRIDLDPSPGITFKDIVRIAHEARALFQDFGMTPYVKTSGSRGLHLLVRVEPRWTFVQARRAVIAFARALERRQPKLVTTSWWKEERGDRVFVDFNQMARDRTVCAAYSTRAKPTATVSAPVRWDELDDIAMEDFTVHTMPARFARLGDVHAGIDDVAFTLDTLLEQAERDERDEGLGDLPYPPEYPKMPGEPLRVQPSRARDR
jgi:DNA ligase D